jgi:hypothetical protein
MDNTTAFKTSEVQNISAYPGSVVIDVPCGMITIRGTSDELVAFALKLVEKAYLTQEAKP